MTAVIFLRRDDVKNGPAKGTFARIARLLSDS